jgi:hypothetical protein
MGKIYRHRTARSDELIGHTDEETGVVYDTRSDKEIAVGRVEYDSGKIYFTRFDTSAESRKVERYTGTKDLAPTPTKAT